MSIEIHHDKPYWSGLLAWTDIHAGGILFGYVYSECLTFGSDQTVTQSFKIFDTFAQMNKESESLSRERNIGSYKINSRGLIECDFEKRNYIGTICKTNSPRVLVFNIHFKNIAIPSSDVVYKLQDSTKQ